MPRSILIGYLVTSEYLDRIREAVIISKGKDVVLSLVGSS